MRAAGAQGTRLIARPGQNLDVRNRYRIVFSLMGSAKRVLKNKEFSNLKFIIITENSHLIARLVSNDINRSCVDSSDCL